MAAMRSIQTNEGSSAMTPPPGSAAALADHCGFTYALAPTYGLSTRAAAEAGVGTATARAAPIASAESAANFLRIPCSVELRDLIAAPYSFRTYASGHSPAAGSGVVLGAPWYLRLGVPFSSAELGRTFLGGCLVGAVPRWREERGGHPAIGSARLCRA